jgi:excisionase family DNA binding protein
MIEPLAIPIAEAARLGGVGRSTIYNEIGNGSLVAHKVGRRTIVKMEDFRTWIAGRDRYPTTVKSNDSQPD